MKALENYKTCYMYLCWRTSSSSWKIISQFWSHGWELLSEMILSSLTTEGATFPQLGSLGRCLNSCSLNSSKIFNVWSTSKLKVWFPLLQPFCVEVKSSLCLFLLLMCFNVYSWEAFVLLGCQIKSKNKDRILM